MKEIPGFEGRYSINESGRVYDNEKETWITYRIRNQFEPHTYLPYLYVNLNGKSYPVHKLVALTYIPNPENKPTIDHIDKNTLNNNVNNLRWATQKEQNHNQNFRVLDRKSKSIPVYMFDLKTKEILKKFNNIREAQIYVKNMKGFSTSRQGTQIKLCCNNKVKSMYGYGWKWGPSYTEEKLW